MRLAYRIQQLKRQFPGSPLSESAWAEVAAELSEAEQALFQRYGDGDQWHSYRVFCTLRAAGHNHPALLKAALLHDVGKTCVPLTIVDRTMIVVLGALWPSRVKAWGKEAGEQGSKGAEATQRLETGDGRLEIGGRWKRPFVVKEQHAEWGAVMVAAAGSPPLVVSLIRRHQDELPSPLASEEDKLLAHLQWADDQN